MLWSSRNGFGRMEVGLGLAMVGMRQGLLGILVGIPRLEPWVVPMHLELQEQEQCATVVVPASRRKGGLSQEELLVNAYCAFLDSPQAPVTAEFKQTLTALYQLTQVPRTVHAVDVNAPEGSY